VLIAAVLALLVGLSLGLLGGGGSILTLPVLVYVVGLDARDAVAASLLIVGVTSAAAMVGHARNGRVQWRVGALFGAASMAGAFAGGRLAHYVPSRVLLAAFTLLMLVTALAMMRSRPEVERASVSLRGAALARVLAVGIAIGMLTGVVGAGGGFVIVPALALLCGLPMRSAVGTSLLVITMNSLAGFAGASAHAEIPWAVVGVMTAAAVVGSFGGAALAMRIAPAALRKGFAWFIVAMTMFMIWKQVPTSVIGTTAGRIVAGSALVLAVLAAVWRLVARRFQLRSRSEIS
jgi:hypothetical protein